MLVLFGLLVTVLCGMTAAPTRADTLGYPYWNMSCEHSPYTLSGDAGYCADYDWGPTPDTTPGWVESKSYDPSYGYGYRNCTDYVAWKESTIGVNATNLGNGGDWYNNAPTSERSSTPKVWDAAVAPGGNHVAFVEWVSADGGTMTISEYNHDMAGTGDQRTITVAGSGFTQFVDFGVHPSGGGSSGGGGGASPSPTTHYPSNGTLLAVSSHPNGEVDVFWKGGDGGLWEGWWSNGRWNGPAGLGYGILGSAPTSVYVPSSGWTFVFWKGTDNHLWEAYWTGSSWNGPIPLGMGTLGSQPSATAWGSEVDVFWKGTDGNLWEAWRTNDGVWHGSANRGMGDMGSAPTAGSHPSGEQDVYWKGGDGNLWETYYNGSWIGPINLGKGTLGSPPTVAVRPSGEQDVFWEGGNGNLWEAWWSGPWYGPNELGWGTLGSPPSATAWGNEVDVFWRGQDGNLWESFWNGTRWYGTFCVGMGYIPQ